MTPTWGQVKGSDASPIPSSAQTLSDSIKSILATAPKVSSTIDQLDWSGIARGAAVSRGSSEQTQMKRVASAISDLKSAVADGGSALDSMIESLKQTANALEYDFFEVADDWTVTDGYNWPLAFAIAADDPATTAKLKSLQAQRAREAEQNSVSLKRRATELATVDKQTADAINAALTSISSTAPTAAGLSMGQGAADAEAFREGRATPTQLARLRAATQLTPAQQAALDRGDPALLPPGQFKYLQSFMHGMDGLTMDEIEQLGAKLPPDSRSTFNGSIGDGLRVISTPGVHSAGAGNQRGGFDHLPDQVQTLLRDHPVRYWDKHYPGARGSFARAEVPRLKEFDALNRVLDDATPGMSNGSFVDKGLIKQAAEIGAAREILAQSHDQGLPGAEAVASAMLTHASHDSVAVHDAVTGVNMDDLVESGHRYDADDHLKGLLNAPWRDNDQGMRDLLAAVERNAHSDIPFANSQAGQTASAISHHIAENVSDYLPKDSQALGERNPGVTQALADLLDEYAPNMVGVPGDVNDTSGFTPLSRGDDVDNLFAVLNSDEESAVSFNRSVLAATAQLEYDFGRTGQAEYTEWASRLSHSASDGVAKWTADVYADDSKGRTLFSDIMNDAVSITGTDVADIPVFSESFGPKKLESLLFGQALTAEEYYQQNTDGETQDVHADVRDQSMLSGQYHSILQGAIDAGEVDVNDPELRDYVQDGQLKSMEEIYGEGGKETEGPRFNARAQELIPQGFIDAWLRGAEW
ncbi:hypothetical protein VZC37_06490 [Gordonia sp. LSe1-13]|uniref:TPR repeat domain-containing protein n=1 Tax=Gordonia sesuvii TaxID=3116777 RepID=A0ABU7MAW8_9ACTN|nr:hypothetical protein [Gordonia sp. LSe1-13]